MAPEPNPFSRAGHGKGKSCDVRHKNYRMARRPYEYTPAQVLACCQGSGLPGQHAVGCDSDPFRRLLGKGGCQGAVLALIGVQPLTKGSNPYNPGL
jgi:hypothetical protein